MIEINIINKKFSHQEDIGMAGSEFEEELTVSSIHQTPQRMS